MKPFVLRRLKQDVLQDLPKKTDSVIHVPMAPTQRERYEELVNTFQSASKDVSLLQKVETLPLTAYFQYDVDLTCFVFVLLTLDSFKL